MKRLRFRGLGKRLESGWKVACPVFNMGLTKAGLARVISARRAESVTGARSRVKSAGETSASPTSASVAPPPIRPRIAVVISEIGFTSTKARSQPASSPDRP